MPWSGSAAGVVVDPLFATGTVDAAAQRYGGDCLGIEVNARYLLPAEHRPGIDPQSAAGPTEPQGTEPAESAALGLAGFPLEATTGIEPV